MSQVIFPSLPGIDWSVTRTAVWSTQVQQSQSGKETRTTSWTYPQWKWHLEYEFLRSNVLAPNSAYAELQTLVAFYNQRQGSFDSFLYQDPTDCTVTNQQIGITDGVTSSFQLVRSFGGYVEPVFAPASANFGLLAVATDVHVAINTTPQSSGYTVDPTTGILTFSTAPAAGYEITASFNYFWRVRFCDDNSEFDNFLYNLWSNQKVEFQTIKQ